MKNDQTSHPEGTKPRYPSTPEEIEFHAIMAADWKRNLAIARAQPNIAFIQIALRLHPNNPTPGIDKIKNMMEYRLVPVNGTTPAFDCIADNCRIGSLYQDGGGRYYFTPTITGTQMSQAIIKDLSFKLHALNAHLDWNKE